jgi:hypothetical protein
MNDDPLHARLTTLMQKTDGAEATAAWWDGDRAGRRQALDDAQSGRRFRKDAHDMAKTALRYLEKGERDTALLAAWAATDFYVAFLESWMARVKPSERPSIAPARRRGAPRKK